MQWIGHVTHSRHAAHSVVVVVAGHAAHSVVVVVAGHAGHAAHSVVVVVSAHAVPSMSLMSHAGNSLSWVLKVVVEEMLNIPDVSPYSAQFEERPGRDIGALFDVICGSVCVMRRLFRVFVSHSRVIVVTGVSHAGSQLAAHESGSSKRPGPSTFHAGRRTNHPRVGLPHPGKDAPSRGGASKVFYRPFNLFLSPASHGIPLK